MIGEARCGKSSIIKRLVREGFSEEYTPTIGIDFKMIKYEKLKVIIWDTSG